MHCCIAPRNNRKQHGLPFINCGDHSSMTMKPISSSGASIMSSMAIDSMSEYLKMVEQFAEKFSRIW